MYKLNARLVLASSSPRRRQLLSECGLDFKVVPSDLDESVGKDESPKDLVMRLAQGKARAVASAYPDCYILGADTDVALGQKIFGKPGDKIEAVSILKELSGTTHQVLGGLALVDPYKKTIHAGLSVTSVTFRKLNDSEIEAYANTAEPYDKAGGYACQGVGASFIKIIEGSYTNVVGLDLSMTLALFREAGILCES